MRDETWRIEVERLMAENADLRRQLEESERDCEILYGPAWKKAIIDAKNGGEVDTPLTDAELSASALSKQCMKLACDLSEAERQRDEAVAACAAMRKKLAMFLFERAKSYEGKTYDRIRHATGIEGTVSTLLLNLHNEMNIGISDAGRDFLAAKQAAERKAKAADGLAEFVRQKADSLHSEWQASEGENRDVRLLIYDEWRNHHAALAAYEAAK